MEELIYILKGDFIMINFFKSYNEEVYKPYRKWTKEHRKGVIILNVVSWGLTAAVAYGPYIKEKIQDKIEERKHKDEI